MMFSRKRESCILHLSTNSVHVLVLERVIDVTFKHVFRRQDDFVFLEPEMKNICVLRGERNRNRVTAAFMRVFPSAGLLEWWRQWWSSLFYRRQTKSIQQQRVNHSRRLSFITAERSCFIFKWNPFRRVFFFWGGGLFFSGACAQHSSSLVCGIMGECFETDSIDCRLLSLPQKLSCQERRLIWL